MESPLFNVMFDRQLIPVDTYLSLSQRRGEVEEFLEGEAKALSVGLRSLFLNNKSRIPPLMESERFFVFFMFMNFCAIYTARLQDFLEDTSERDLFIVLFTDWFFEQREKLLPKLDAIKAGALQ